MLYVVLRPDKTPLPSPYVSQEEAQTAIAEIEPDILIQSTYQIHPIQTPRDAERLKLKVHVDWQLEKFDGDFVGQAPVEVMEGAFDVTY